MEQTLCEQRVKQKRLKERIPRAARDYPILSESDSQPHTYERHPRYNGSGRAASQPLIFRIISKSNSTEHNARMLYFPKQIASVPKQNQALISLDGKSVVTG